MLMIGAFPGVPGDIKQGMEEGEQEWSVGTGYLS